MKNTNLLRNVVYNMLNQAVSMIAPLITAPYIARVFTADLIGAYGYSLANSSYFVLLECFGFALYGQIKIAEVRDNKMERSILFYEIAILKTIFMIISIITYFFLYVKNLSGISYYLACTMLLNIIANGLDFTWFLMGLEEFRLIAIRTTVIRIINVILVLLCVKSSDDIVLYALIMQGATFFSSIVVFPAIFKRTDKPSKKRLRIFYHLKGATIYFVPGLITTIFSSTDKTMLGIFSGNYEVGIYEQANKISQIGMNAICAIGNALMPRAAYLYHNRQMDDEANDMFLQSFNIVALTSCPIAFGMASIAKTFVPVFFGPGYDKSALILPILSANVAIVSLSNLCGQQLLIARNHQQIYNCSITISAISNVLLNYLMIKSDASIGAAIASVISSFFGLVLIIKFSQLHISIKRLIMSNRKYLYAALIMFFVVKCLSWIHVKPTALVCIEIIVGAIVYISILILLKDEYVKYFLHITKIKSESKSRGDN